MQTARSANETSLRMFGHVAAAMPEIRSDLANIHHSRGVILAKLGQNELAHAEFADARALFEPLVAEFPEFPQYADRLGNALYELAKLSYAAATRHGTAQQKELEQASFEQALDFVGRAAELHQRVLDRYAQDATYRAHLSSDYFLKAWTVKKLGAARSQSLKHTATIETAEALVTLSPDNADHLKLTGELYALAAQLASNDLLLEASLRQQLQSEYAARAIELLRVAIEKGYIDNAVIRNRFRFRYDHYSNTRNPDRAEFMFPLPIAVGGRASLATGPLDWDEYRAYTEIAFSDNFSLFGELKDWVSINAYGAGIAGANSSNVISYGLGFGYDVKQGCRCGQTPRVTAVFEVLGWTVLEGLRSTGIQAAAGILVDATGETIVNSKYGIRYTQGKNSFYGGYGNSLTDHVWYESVLRV